MLATREQELAWLAGFADGEGSIFIGKAQRKKKSGDKIYIRYELTFVVVQAIQRPILRYKEMFGGFIKCRMPKPHERLLPKWYWTTVGTNAYNALKELLPYLDVKREEALNGIAYQEFKDKERGVSGKGKGKGFRFTPQALAIIEDFRMIGKKLNNPEYEHLKIIN